MYLACNAISHRFTCIRARARARIAHEWISRVPLFFSFFTLHITKRRGHLAKASHVATLPE